ncbi:MAG: DUF2145 domain-containing protein [Maricaulaceae bacterium]|jgi:hypothetical protein
MLRKVLAAPALAAAVAIAPLGFIEAPAAAQSSAQNAAVRLTADEAADFSKQVEHRLAEDGARVAIVFRTGRSRDNLPEGVEYTHGAFWVYRDVVLDGGESTRGYAVYNLYQGDGETLPVTRSYLHQDWPIDFTLPSAVDDVGVIIPSPEMQRRIIEIIDSPLYEALHNPDYSLIANPHENTYQNCNSFMLAVIASAAWETDNLEQIAANLRAYYEPQPLEVGVLARVFGPMFDRRLRTDDQSGALQTATFRSMERFMETYGLLKESYVLARSAES